MKSLSGSRFTLLFAALVLMLLSTRFKHFGDMLHLPDASMAIFFIGGLTLRKYWAFAVFVLLAVAVDEVAIHYDGISDFCMTIAYAFLPLAYAVLWYGGRWYSSRLRADVWSLIGAWCVALLSASLSFAVSNGSFYWFGGRYASPHMGEYLERLWQWAPLFVGTTLGYVTAALLAYAVGNSVVTWYSAHRVAEART